MVAGCSEGLFYQPGNPARQGIRFQDPINDHYTGMRGHSSGNNSVQKYRLIVFCALMNPYQNVKL